MWQSELVKKIPEVTFKAHPKTRSLMGMEQSVRIETKTLENCLDEYDIFILDYFSTAMTLAMHSNKPIVFFDIGLRNMTEEFLVFVKERCFYTVINMTEELSGQIAHALDQYALSNCTWSNKGLGKYSLNDQVSPEARYRFTRIFL